MADLLTYFTLSAADLAFVEKRRVEHNRLGFALQLSTLRYLNFCPADLTAAPMVIVSHLAEQLKVSQTVLAAYAQRAQTRTEHLQEGVFAFWGRPHPPTPSPLRRGGEKPPPPQRGRVGEGVCLRHPPISPPNLNAPSARDYGVSGGPPG